MVVAVRFSESLQTICWLASLPVYRIYLINKGSPLPPNASGVLGRLVRGSAWLILQESYPTWMQCVLCELAYAILGSQSSSCKRDTTKHTRLPVGLAGWSRFSSGAAPCFSYYGDVRPFSFGLRIGWPYAR